MEFKHQNHICRYSRKINQPYPRLCIDCGEEEKYNFSIKEQLHQESELPQQEISDEEIEKEAKNHHNYYEWSAGAKWYREQLKQRR